MEIPLSFCCCPWYNHGKKQLGQRPEGVEGLLIEPEDNEQHAAAKPRGNAPEPHNDSF